MNNLVKDRFDNVGITITNSRDEINLDLIVNSLKKMYGEILRNGN